jgi:acyl-CoA reductase-like NAD-dependent aldehyde dehydrogenase
VGVAAAAGQEDARAAADAAAKAFPAWAASQPGTRREILLKAADLLSARAEQIAQLVSEETGGVFGWGMFNVSLASAMLREAAAQAYGLVGEVIPSDIPGKLAMGVRQPAGVVLAIAPWTAPVILCTRALATPLAYGNTVVLKASELCPRTHAAVVNAVIGAGLPPGVLNLITNDPADAGDVVEELIAHPAVRRINFTGSTKVGRIIAQTAGRHLKRVLLELGGKAPMVVLRDADLEPASAAAHFGAGSPSRTCRASTRSEPGSEIQAKRAARAAARGRRPARRHRRRGHARSAARRRRARRTPRGAARSAHGRPAAASGRPTA